MAGWWGEAGGLRRAVLCVCSHHRESGDYTGWDELIPCVAICTSACGNHPHADRTARKSSHAPRGSSNPECTLSNQPHLRVNYALCVNHALRANCRRQRTIVSRQAPRSVPPFKKLRELTSSIWCNPCPITRKGFVIKVSRSRRRRFVHRRRPHTFPAKRRISTAASCTSSNSSAGAKLAAPSVKLGSRPVAHRAPRCLGRRLAVEGAGVCV